jgi:ribose transport system ATP-binding protein
MSEYIIKMCGIEKAFGANCVLHHVDFSLKKGSIHALLGENGTGKTTLMNILGGVIPGDAGEIAIDGAVNKIGDRMHGNLNEIAFIHQELTLINDLNIYENLFLGRELKKGGRLDKKSMYDQAAEILGRMKIDLDPAARVEDINASYKQIVEIARALMKNSKVIIMDEPTTSLTNVEIAHVFHIMKELKSQGISFVFISHKLNEVMEICDSYTVMRDGCVVSSGAVGPDVSEQLLAKYMVGKELSYNDLYMEREIGPDILQVQNLSRASEFTNINFHVGQGEIVGFTGLLGDGRYEVFHTVYGCNKQYTGDIFIRDSKYKMDSTVKAKKLKISYLPRNRKENGIIKDLSIAHNLSISIIKKLQKHLFIEKKKEKQFNQDYVEKLNIKLNHLNDLIVSLSGGNQQKVILARALSSNPDLVILDNPTQGVDIGAKLEIYGIIMQLAKEGMSFVVLSSEAQEVLMLCDRIYVMYHGEIRKEFPRAEANEENIMIVATGGKL